MDRKGIVGLLASHQLLHRRACRNAVAASARLAQASDVRHEVGASLVDPDGRQLASANGSSKTRRGPKITVAEHHRRSSQGSPEYKAEDEACASTSRCRSKRFASGPKLDDDHEIIGEKVTIRLAQRARQLRRAEVHPRRGQAEGRARSNAPPAPAGVMGKSLADVSLLACMAIDKFAVPLAVVSPASAHGGSRNQRLARRP